VENIAAEFSVVKRGNMICKRILTARGKRYSVTKRSAVVGIIKDGEFYTVLMKNGAKKKVYDVVESFWVQKDHGFGKAFGKEFS
jgi:hypothetical protein